MDQRPDWNTYFMLMAIVASSRSTCIRRKVGSVLVRNHQILSTGYNGAPKNTPHCCETSCLRQKMNIPSGERHEICRGSHAEINAIAQAALRGISTEGATVYCTHEPCAYCTKALINAGCVKVYYLHPYPDNIGRSIMKEAGIEAVQIDAATIPHNMPEF